MNHVFLNFWELCCLVVITGVSMSVANAQMKPEFEVFPEYTTEKGVCGEAAKEVSQVFLHQKVFSYPIPSFVPIFPFVEACENELKQGIEKLNIDFTDPASLVECIKPENCNRVESDQCICKPYFKKEPWESRVSLSESGLTYRVEDTLSEDGTQIISRKVFCGLKILAVAGCGCFPIQERVSTGSKPASF